MTAATDDQAVPGITADDRAAAVVAITPREAHQLDVNRQTESVARWRQANPFARSRWLVAHGVVTGWIGWKFYRGECTGCGDLLTHRRPYPAYGGIIYRQGVGPWPKLCGACRQQRRDDEPLNARKRMARLRREGYAARDAHMVALGFTPPRQGVAPVFGAPAVRSVVVGKRLAMFCPVCLEPVDFATVRPR